MVIALSCTVRGSQIQTVNDNTIHVFLKRTVKVSLKFPQIFTENISGGSSAVWLKPYRSCLNISEAILSNTVQ